MERKGGEGLGKERYKENVCNFFGVSLHSA